MTWQVVQGRVSEFRWNFSSLCVADRFFGKEYRRVKFPMKTILALAALAAWPAAASQRHGFGGGRIDVQMQQHRQGGFQRQPQQQPQRDFQRRDAAPDRRSDGRLTDEERRDLHRDLDRANREIYKGRR
jgi:hypothetical protein